jgi:acyl carrier protein
LDKLFSKLETVFKDVFDDPTLTVKPKTNAADVPGWDSITHINLIYAIEEEFKIKFALGEIQELNNVGEMAELIEKKRPGI